MEDNLRVLSSFSTLISENEENDVFPLLHPLLDGTGPDMQYLRLGLATRDGHVYTTDQYTDDISCRDYFLTAINGQPTVSSRLIDLYLGVAVNVYAVPAYTADEVTGVLFAVVPNDDFQAMLPTSFVEQQGFSMIAEKKGHNVAGSLLSGGPGSANSVFDVFFVNTEDIRRVLSDFQESATGTIRYLRDGAEWYASYTPLAINDWYLLTATPVSVTTEYADRMILRAWLTWSAFILAVIALLIALNVQRSLRIRAYTRYISTDEVTGIHNWHSFCQKAKPILHTHPPASYVFVRIGIDRYQAFQDFFGKDATHAFLRNMAQLLEQSLWSTELCAHYVDDTFVLLLHHQVPMLITPRLQGLLDNSSDLQPNFPLPFSCGVVEVEHPDMQLSTLFEQAKYACQHIVELHDTHICFFDEDRKNAMQMETKLEQNMYEAIRQEQFTAYFQPKYSLSRQRYVGAEALVRWIHPEYSFYLRVRLFLFLRRTGSSPRWICMCWSMSAPNYVSGRRRVSNCCRFR